LVLLHSEEKTSLNFDSSYLVSPDIDGKYDIHTPKILLQLLHKVFQNTNHKLILKVEVLLMFCYCIY